MYSFGYGSVSKVLVAGCSDTAGLRFGFDYADSVNDVLVECDGASGSSSVIVLIAFYSLLVLGRSTYPVG